MKLVKSLLLGSAAGFCAVAGAQAADLPIAKAAPVEYVRVCPIHGVGFFYIPGTDTCIRVGGRAQFAYEYFQTASIEGPATPDKSMFRGLGRLQVDARTSTAFGTLRTFVRFDIFSATGQPHLASATLNRYGPLAFNAAGVDTFRNAQTGVVVDKAFIQFAGFTAGKASSFYDFYVTDVELTNFSVTSNAFSTNLIAYTAQFGGGFSATLSVEDPNFRRNPVFTNTSGTGYAITGLSGPFTTPIFVFLPGFSDPVGLANFDISQRTTVPDVVGVLRVDQPWGSAQLSAALHTITLGNFVGSITPFNTQDTRDFRDARSNRPGTEYGYAVQGGVKFNLPFIAPGDALWLQAAFAHGAMSYTGLDGPIGREAHFKALGNGGPVIVSGQDGFVDRNGNLQLTDSWSFAVAALHFWAPQWRSGFAFTYGELSFPSGARGPNGPLGRISDPLNFNFKDFSTFVALGNLIWSPVADLDIGVEVLYERLDPRGRVNDITFPSRSVNFDDALLARVRIDRTF